MVVQSPQHCLNFDLVPRLFPKDGKFGVYFKISTGGDIRTAAIIGRYTLHIYAWHMWYVLGLRRHQEDGKEETHLSSWSTFAHVTYFI